MRSFSSLRSPKRIESFESGRPLVAMLPLHVGARVSSPPVQPDVAASLAPAEPEAVEQLTLEQKMALLQSSRRVSTNAVYHAMRKKMEDDGSQVPPFTLSTFDALRELGLCARPNGERYHSLTTSGGLVADRAARSLAREFKLHYSWLGGTNGFNKSVHCVCGWHRVVTSGRNQQSNAALAYTQHIATVRGMNTLTAALTKPKVT